MGVLGLADGHKPRTAGQIRGLCDQYDSSILRMAPEGLCPVKGWFLDRAVVAVGRPWPSKSDERIRLRSGGSIEGEIALRIDRTIVGAKLRFRRWLIFQPNQANSRMDKRRGPIRTHYGIWTKPDQIAAATVRIEGVGQQPEIPDQFNVEGPTEASTHRRFSLESGCGRGLNRSLDGRDHAHQFRMEVPPTGKVAVIGDLRQDVRHDIGRSVVGVNRIKLRTKLIYKGVRKGYLPGSAAGKLLGILDADSGSPTLIGMI